MINIGVLVSGSGSNLQALLDASKEGKIPNARIRVVVSSHPGVKALERARNAGVEAFELSYKKFPDSEQYSQRLVDELVQRNIQAICLAGFVRKLEPLFIRQFQGRILNIHPALLPKFGGQGMYGMHVHEAVIASGDKESGPTVHMVDEKYDHGSIILQKKIPVLPNDTAQTLAARVLEVEHKIYPEALKIFCEKLENKYKK